MDATYAEPKPQSAFAAVAKPSEDSPEYAAKCAAVKMWTARLRKAKQKWEPEIKRMREDMDFVYGLQWEGQDKLAFHKYVCNITLQMVNQKVATLYARNPEATATRRKRKDFQVWDEKLETLMQATQALQASTQMGMPDVGAAAVLLDYQQGTQMRAVIDKVCETLEIVYQYELDSQEPDFKEQMKQVVRTVVICGVGFVRLNFARDVNNAPSASHAPRSAADRAKRARLLLEKIEKGEIQDDDPQIETLKQLAASFGVTATSEQVEVEERLVVDYPPATSIIVDDKCKSLKTFANARWIAQEYILPMDEANAFFEADIKIGGELKLYGGKTGEQQDLTAYLTERFKDEDAKPMVCVWEIFDITTKSHFFICDGYKHYLMEPEAVSPSTRRFWPIFGLTFNDTVVEPGVNATIYPPSDVRLMWHPQKEWNRTRNSLRAQRRANAPKYIARHGLLTDDDKAKLNSASDNEVIELRGIPPDVQPDKFILPAEHAAIDPLAYDTKPLEQDIMYAARSQEANMGPAPKNVTATVGNIAEQSRMTVASSNVDDLDGLLSSMARTAGEILLWSMSPQTVKRIAGQGAVWPLENRADFVNQVELSIVASSSGRPNKAIEVSNFERMAPLLLQFGANPMFLIREGVKRLDDRIDINQAFPIVPPALGAPTTPQGVPPGGQPGGPAVPQPRSTLGPPQQPPGL